MLVRCNKGCKESGGTTEGALDVETNEVICTNCQDVLEDVSDYSKRMMKSTGDILRKKGKRGFAFECGHCNKIVEVKYDMKNTRIVGDGCENPDDCCFDLPEPMVEAIKLRETNKMKVL